MNCKQPTVRVYRDLDALSRAAAAFTASQAGAAGKGGRTFSIALSGGTTPQRLYALLGTGPEGARIPWPFVHVFWADERCVAEDHPESNFRLVQEELLSRRGIPAWNVHRIKGEEGPDRAAREYEQELRSFFGTAAIPAFDLVILGVGRDGHTASLFPGMPQTHDRANLAAAVPLEAPGLSRVTLTLPVLDHAREVLYLASGRTKARVLHEILENGNPKGYPAGMVRPQQGRVTWLIDRDAAGLLSSSFCKHERAV